MNNYNNVVLITGASKGLGLALARLFARRGHRLVINARGEEALRRAARDVAELTQVIAVPGDVSEIAETIAAKARTFGRVDILINNASELGPMVPLREHPWQSLERVF